MTLTALEALVAGLLIIGASYAAITWLSNWEERRDRHH